MIYIQNPNQILNQPLPKGPVNPQNPHTVLLKSCYRVGSLVGGYLYIEKIIVMLRIVFCFLWDFGQSIFKKKNWTTIKLWFKKKTNCTKKTFSFKSENLCGKVKFVELLFLLKFVCLLSFREFVKWKKNNNEKTSFGESCKRFFLVVEKIFFKKVSCYILHVT